jgi:hypothetical protein
MQTRTFSRIEWFLPTRSPASASDDIEPLKRAHFILFKLVIVCHISSINPPLIPALKDGNQAIEKRGADKKGLSKDGCYGWMEEGMTLATNPMSCTPAWTAMRLALTLHLNLSMSPAGGKRVNELVRHRHGR